MVAAAAGESDRPASAAVHSLDHLVMSVPDLRVARLFYEAFGLEVRVAGDELAIHAAGDAHCWLRLREGRAKRLDQVIFGAHRDDLAGIARRLTACGADEVRIIADAIDCRDPDGTGLRVIAAPKSSPAAKSVPSNRHRIAPAGEAAAPLRSAAPKVRPRRLAHVLFFTSNIGRSVAFYTTALGLRLSDEADGKVAFLHGPHGSDHHLIAFSQSSGPGFHHSAWDVGSVDEVGLGAMQMAAAGFGEGGWGVGRHVLGSNYFHYVRDPWHSYAEYSFDIDYIPAGMDWQAGHHSAENGFYLWGPAPPLDFGTNHERGHD